MAGNKELLKYIIKYYNSNSSNLKNTYNNYSYTKTLQNKLDKRVNFRDIFIRSITLNRNRYIKNLNSSKFKISCKYHFVLCVPNCATILTIVSSIYKILIYTCKQICTQTQKLLNKNKLS